MSWLAEYLWSDEVIDRLADAIADVPMPQLAEDVDEWHADCACAVIEILAGPRSNIEAPETP